MNEDYDLIIVGSGMAGATLAIALADLNLNIAVFDKFIPNAKTQPAYHDRGIALAHGSKKILQQLGLWGEIAPYSAPIKQIHISEKGGFGFSRLNADDHQVDALGYVVTAPDLGQALLSRISGLENVDLIAPVEINKVRQTEKKLIIRTDQDREYATPLLVAADGSNSFVRNALDFPMREWHYDQAAVVANISSSNPKENTAFERFTNQGPVALLPMTENRYALVWTVHCDEVDQVLSLDDEKFMQTFQDKFGWRVGHFERVSKRLSYQLTHKRCTESVKPRVAVIGNAAHTLHPVAGQGFNLGLRDVIALSNTIHQAFSTKLDFGNLAVLNEYELARRADQRNISLATDSLARIFTNPLPPVKLLRNLGLLAFDSLPPLKKRFTKTAMGLHVSPGITSHGRTK